MRAHDGPRPLTQGDELHCPHCRAWHPVRALHDTGTDYTREMLYWECRGGHYYAGQTGSTGSRYPTRSTASPGETR